MERLALAAVLSEYVTFTRTLSVKWPTDVALTPRHVALAFFTRKTRCNQSIDRSMNQSINESIDQ